MLMVCLKVREKRITATPWTTITGL